MEITDKRTDPIVEFGTLEVADVFLHGGEVCMKILPVDLHDGGFHKNAFCLESTHLYYFNDDDTVNAVNAELVLKD